MNRKQAAYLLLAIAAVLGLVLVPPLLQYFYGIDAVKTTFAVIVIYAAINLWMKRDQ